MMREDRTRTPAQAALASRWRPLTVRDAVASASRLLRERDIDSPLLDARLIVAHCLGVDPADIYRKPDLPLDPRQERLVSSLIERRASGIPTAYVTGTREFWSLPFAVDERVLIPRPETEILVEESLTAARDLPDPLTVIELGTGSGAVSVALSVELLHARIVSTDISEDALSVARMNIARHGLADRITLRHGDLFSAVGSESRFDLVVSNPPYLTDREMHTLSPDVRSEPALALNGGRDGLSVIGRMLTDAAAHMTTGAFFLLEIGAGQEDAVRRLIVSTGGLSYIRTRTDYAGHPRVVIAQRTH